MLRIWLMWPTGALLFIKFNWQTPFRCPFCWLCCMFQSSVCLLFKKMLLSVAKLASKPLQWRLQSDCLVSFHNLSRSCSRQRFCTFNCQSIEGNDWEKNVSYGTEFWSSSIWIPCHKGKKIKTTCFFVINNTALNITSFSPKFSVTLFQDFTPRLHHGKHTNQSQDPLDVTIAKVVEHWIFIPWPKHRI